jgi:hypothetical protein
MSEANMTNQEIRDACIVFWKIKKIAEKHHDERYDTDWDDMQSKLEKIWKLTK